MRRVALAVVLLLAVLFAREASARKRMFVGGPVGFGVAMGAPTGLTIDLSLAPRWDIEATAGTDPSEDGRWYGHLGITYALKDLVRPKFYLSAPIYLGLGVTAIEDGANLGDDVRWGVRVPVGFAVDTSIAPFRFFLELAPRIDIDGFEAGFSGMLGFRFFPGGG